MMLIKIHVSAPQQHKKLTKLQETNIDSKRGIATRITDSTLVPVPRSVSGGEPGFISIYYRIFWLPKNMGGGVAGAYALDQVEHNCWIRDYFANVRLCLFCEMNFSHTCLFFKYASKSQWYFGKKSNSKKLYFVLSEILQRGPSWLLISVF